jgi:hypothetical protein
MSDPDRYRVTDVTAPRGGKDGRGRNKQGRAKPTKRDCIVAQLDHASGLLARWGLEPVRLVGRSCSGGRVRITGEAATPDGYPVSVLMLLGSPGQAVIGTPPTSAPAHDLVHLGDPVELLGTRVNALARPAIREREAWMSKASGKINAANPPSADPAASPVPAPKYEPKPQERAAVEAWFDRRRQRAPAPRLKVEKKGSASQVALDHPHPETGSILLMAAVGTSSADFLQSLICQLVNAGSKGPAADEDVANFMLAVVTGIEPRDEVEAMLASQMAAVHMATMTFARRLNHIDNIPQQDSAERAFNKLARTFAMQVEALKRYRTGGEHRVVVHQVNVNDGGQAIVGSVSPRPAKTGRSAKRAG